MRVVYKNKYKAVRTLWRRVDLCMNVSRFIAGLTVIITVLCTYSDWVKGVMAFVSGAAVWGVYVLLTENRVKRMKERIEDLQKRQDDAVNSVAMSLVPDGKGDKFTVGLEIDGRLHRMVAGSEDVPVVVDCLTDTAVVSTDLENIINNWRKK